MTPRERAEQVTDNIPLTLQQISQLESKIIDLITQAIKDAVTVEGNEQLAAHNECIETAVTGAIAAEREASAKVAETFIAQSCYCDAIAQAIRNRK